MNGIYLTEQTKLEIEAKIAGLETTRNESSSDNNDYYLGRLKELKEILSSATVLPVEKSWGSVPMGTNECELVLPYGVIIDSNEHV
jgi:hypothetical protein